MADRRYVIVGNGFAGTTCAEQLRKLDPACSIILFADEPYCLYNRIALPPMLRKQVTEQKVIMRDLAWHEKHGIDLRLGTRVDAVDTAGKTVTANGSAYPYDALLLATGGRPNPAASPGAAGAHNVYNFQYLDETKAISEALETAKVGVSVGGSFIAYELAEAFVSRGVETHWLIRGPRFLRRMLDEAAGELLHDAARTDGVHLHFGEEVREMVRSNGAVSKVVTTSGTTIDTDLVGIGLGLTINLELCEGTEIRTRTGIVTDEHLETDVKGVFAAGDCAEFYDPIAEQHYRMGTWNSAGAHGKLAAHNMAAAANGAERKVFDTVPEYSSLVFSGQTITQFGLSPEYRDDIETEMHVDRDRGWYRALYFLEDRFVGAVLIGKGNRAGKRRYLDAIKTKARFPKADRKALLDWTAD
ncbi:pyridine nucleotide-disulfide oxidoreductase [Vulcanimicrobium alpinum]|uniref:Pyridine nucleotide-disulfide oxidoreductase n=1 Tax=Vulcanimicrobium alpinum TaxID=3016050 RepID=A0AAN1XUC4_UNVUL|nr:FAD-dependent oxidoreductase [Vulcanimicrobium alpinum]BDE05687.1 pyridine nucleotide-disulfide oxidoreductase [Vulcanimicrobium alpinum]